MIISRKHSIGLVAILSAVVAGGTAAAQTVPAPAASSSVAPIDGQMQMPLVSPQQAEQFFATRVVPPSTLQAPAAAPSSGPLQALNVDPILGHELPTDAVSAAGFPRADFAIAKPKEANKKSPLGDTAAISPSGPSTTVIREEPPVIGKP